MADRDTRTGGEAQGSNEELRECPSCGVRRPDSAFRSRHPATHCDRCHAAKRRGDSASAEEPDSASAQAKPERVARGEAPDPAQIRSRAEARRRRLALLGEDVPNTCPVLGIELDWGPRSQPSARPAMHAGRWVSTRAARVLAVGLTADELVLVAEWLEREGG